QPPQSWGQHHFHQLKEPHHPWERLLHRQHPDTLKLLHLIFKLISFSKLIAVEPRNGLINSIFNLLLISCAQISTNLLILYRVPHVIGIILQSILGLHLLLVLLVLCLPALVVDAIGINIEADSDLRHTPGGWWDARELEFTQQIVVSGPCSLTLINLDQNTGLVIRWRDIQQQEVLHLLIPFTTQNCSLNSRTISNSLIRVDTLAKFLPIKEVLQQLLYLGNSGGATNKNNIVDRALVHLGIPQTLLHRFHTLPEQVHVKFLKSGPGYSCIEVDPLKQRINLNGGLSSGGERPLCPLTRCPQPPQGSRITTDILLVLPLELLNEMVHHSVIKILTSKMGISSCRFNLKNTLFNGKQGDIKSAATKIKDEHIFLTNARSLLVKTVGNCSGSWLIDNTHDIQSGNYTGILGSLALGIIEVCRNSDNCILNR
ncbi:hypothetical protein RJ639_044255, partial [Escallonia herrerae]